MLSEIGALSVDAFMKKSERKSLAAALNSLLAAPSFASWRPGTTLQRLAPRWFVVRSAHATPPPILMQPRFAMPHWRKTCQADNSRPVLALAHLPALEKETSILTEPALDAGQLAWPDARTS